MIKRERYLTIYLLLLLFFMLFDLGCDKSEMSKKVSLNKRSSAVEDQGRPSDVGSLKFGFDLRLGPKDDVKIYLPFLRYLEQNAGNRFSLRFTEKYEDTAENLGRGITHFAAMGPANGVIAKERYGAGCLVMGLNHEGKPEYRAVIFTRIDSPLSSLKNLKGKTIAFGDKFSTQGHLIPRKMLEDSGVTVEKLKNYAFTGSHANAAKAVLNREYDAGGMQDTLAKKLVAEGKIKILASSKPYPSSLICFNKNVDPVILKAVKATLLALEPTGRHAGLLVDWDRTEMPKGFTECNEHSLIEIKELAGRYGILNK